ncbi:hypothetical protein WME97_44840 [Sorangium sp. So ce367]|uniref:hypothetical protein n=1 Tax=Sorangium sp. So ce367 TaxID=3133305 RepID=UPI003F5E03CF
MANSTRWLVTVALGAFSVLGCSDDTPSGNSGGAAAGGQGGSQAGGGGSSGAQGGQAQGPGGSGGGQAGQAQGGGAGSGATRSFALGFTPFPYDVTSQAVDWTYGALKQDGDLFAFHTTQGVAWVEALEGKSAAQYGAHIKAEWAKHVAQIPAGHKVYVGLTPLDDSRTKLADYWGDMEHMPLPGEWAGYALDAPQVITAYINFCEAAVGHYKPDYLGIGIEVNLLKKQNPSAWPAYLTLHKKTYEALKQKHPTLPVFASVTAVDLLKGWTDADHEAQMQALAELLPYTDHLALSFYPYMSAYLANPVPAGTFDQLAALAPGKPMLIAETGFPAQSTELPSSGLTFEGTEAKQDAWLSLVLAEADKRKMPMVVNFVARDYDALWTAAGGGDLLAVWRDTGLYAEDGSARKALASWKDWLGQPRSP